MVPIRPKLKGKMKISGWSFFLWLSLAFCACDSAFAIPLVKALYYELCGPLVSQYAKNIRTPDSSHDALAILVQMGTKSWTEDEMRTLWGKRLIEKKVAEEVVRYVNQFPPWLQTPAAYHYCKDRVRAWNKKLGQQAYIVRDDCGFWRTHEGEKFLDDYITLYEILEHEISPGGFPDIVRGTIKVPTISHSQLVMVASIYRLERSKQFEKISPAIVRQDLEALYEKLKFSERTKLLGDTFATDLDLLVDRDFVSRKDDNLFYTVSGREQLQRAFSLYKVPDNGIEFSDAAMRELLKAVNRSPDEPKEE